MALTRKFLSALGIEADKIDEIITAHTETVDGLKEDIKKYKTDAEAYATAKAELEELKSATSKDDSYKIKYDAIKAQFEEFKKDLENKATAEKKATAYKALLSKAGVSEKLVGKILAVTKLDDFKLDGDDIKDADKVLDSIKEEWADFIVKTKAEGETTKTPPKGTGAKKTTDEILAIKDPVERQKAIAENLDSFTM